MSINGPISDMRRSYEQGQLDHSGLAADPFQQFSSWFETAVDHSQPKGFFRRFGVGTYKWFQSVVGKSSTEANAMTLATADIHGRPSARIVLLKAMDERGFIFFSHYEGAKGRELAENPQAALLFHWADLERQVNIGGTVERISKEESDAYFQSRPRGSRLAVWAARQSDVVPDRKFLENKWKEVEQRFPKDIPKPDYWGGFRLVPSRIEFWQGRPSRLHDRYLYTRDGSGQWKIDRLAP